MRARLLPQTLSTRWGAAQHLRMPTSLLSSPSLGMCSESEVKENPKPTLKAQLRLLFKLIHPDLFHNQPLEQAINQNSFQLLQEYLNAAKGGGSYRQRPYHFVFFIRDGAAAENLKKVEISLPPPQVRFVNEKKTSDLLPTTRRALTRLLAACGLSEFVTTAEEDQVRLSELFQEASEILRQNEASAVDYERQVAASKNALALGRGIKVSFRPPLSELARKSQVESLEKLAISLDRAQDVKLSGHSLIIGDCYGIDALGNLWLKHEDSVDGWSKFLECADLSKAARNKKDAAERRILELKAARLMEVEMVFTHDGLAVQPEYTHFLNNTIKEALNCGAVGEGKFSKLPIRVTCPNRELNSESLDGAESDEARYMKVDDTFGYISVPVWESLPNIYNFIQQRGSEALQIRERLKHSEKHVDQVKLLVRRKLRLRELIFDRKLRSDMCLAACTRLLHFAPDLEKYMEGLSLCISDEHRLPVEGSKSFLCLKWNFSMAEL